MFNLIFGELKDVAQEENRNPQSQRQLQGKDNSGKFKTIASPQQIISQLQELQKTQHQKQPIKEATIVIQGDQIKSINSCCLCATIIAGCLLCLPWLCCLCRCWKKIVWPVFGVPIETYKKLDVLLKIKSLKFFKLVVVDNYFDKQKADCLYQMLSQSQVKSFEFINGASGTNWKNKEYSNFVQNMKPIKSLQSITSKMIWHNKTVF